MSDGIWTGDSYIPDMGTFGDLCGSDSGDGGYYPAPKWFGWAVLTAGILFVCSFFYWVHKKNVEFDKCMQKPYNFRTYCEYFASEDH